MTSGRAEAQPDERVARDAATFYALQRLEQGELQQLGDRLLPWMFAVLTDLKSHGLSAEGKTRTGVPDSFVGPSAELCSIGVEYTSQREGLSKKLEGDCRGVRSRCPAVRDVFLCTNRVVANEAKQHLQNLGAAESIRVTVLDGVDLADALFADRQDLRLDHLGIPIATHSRWTLLPAMRRRLEEALPSRISGAVQRRAIPHEAASGRLHLLAEDPTAVAVLAVGRAGSGKSVWSARELLSRAELQPAFWIPASDLRLSTADPITVTLVRAAFGTSEVSRGIDLADLLRRERLRALLAIDGIDEVRDVADLLLALREFRTAALGPHTLLLLTCREEALPYFEDSLSAWRPELLKSKDGTLISLGTLKKYEVYDFLRAEGATAEEARAVENTLPAHLALNPLFLSQALALAKAGASLDADRAIQSYASFALKDVHDRLRQNGRAPGMDVLGRAFAEIALNAIGSPADEAAREVLERVLGAEGLRDGEGTIVGRATQVGLLETRADNRVGFQHPLYLEYFAATAVESSWRSPLPDLATDAGKQVARRLVPFLTSPAWLIEALLRLDATTACECAAAADGLPASVAASLVAAVAPMLESRFPSDRRRAFALLGQISSREAREAAVAWWNRSDPNSRALLWPTAADVFLALELPGAFEVIIGHRAFWPEHPWYEPAFLAKIQRLSTAFREAMIALGRRDMEEEKTTEEKRLRIVSMLALFGDTDFVGALRTRVDGGSLLSDAELRALIHANTEEAMEVYAVAVDNVIGLSLDQEPGISDEERQRSQGYRRDQLVLRTLDIHMYPHDALTNLAEDALSSPFASPVMWFGESLAAFLGEERLVVPYTSAKNRRGRGYIDFGNRVVETLLKRISPTAMVELYVRHEDVSIRKQIVHSAHQVFGRITEDFLLERVARREFLFDAVQSLGLMRSYRAGAAILEAFVGAADFWTREVCIRALGRMRYAPAENALCAALRKETTGGGDDGHYLIPGALAHLGGESSIAALVEVFPRTRRPERVLGALFKLGAPGAREAATSLAREYRVSARVLAEALDPFDSDELNRERVKGDLNEPRLLDLLLEGADESLALPSMERLHYISAVARFALPAAIAFLERIAAGTGPEKLEALGALAALGRRSAIQECIDGELRAVEGGQRFVSSFEVDRLENWPPAVVREALLARIERGAYVDRWVFLLQWFAEPEDVALFRRIESGDDVVAADIAHEYLRDNTPTMSIRSRGLRPRA